MTARRWWSGSGIVVATVVLASCTQGQIEQVLQNKTQDVISGACQTENGLVSAAPEFCLYVTELRVTHDTEADVNLTIANRTGRRLYLKIPSRPSLSDSSGTKWGHMRTTGIESFGSGGYPLPLDPNVNAQITIVFRQSGQVVPPDLTFSMTGEVMVFKADSRGEMMRQVAPIATRGFQFSGIRQVSQQPAQPAATSGLQGATPPLALTSPATKPGVQGGGAAVATAPATPVSADIVGLRLGMTPDEVRQAIREHDKNFKVNEQQASLQGLPGSTFLSQVAGGLDKRLPIGPLDSIGVHFPPPPHKSQAMFIHRFTGFEQGNQPLITAIQDALIKKYGTPSFIREHAGETLLMWGFDPSGARIIDSSVERKCARFNVSEPQSTSNYFFEKRPSDGIGGCGVTIQATVVRKDLQGKVGSELTGALYIYIINSSVGPSMRAVTQSYVDGAVRDSAMKVPTPKF